MKRQLKEFSLNLQGITPEERSLVVSMKKYNDAALTCDYKHRNSTYNDFYVKSNQEYYNLISLYNATGGSIVVRIMESDDDLTYVESSTVTVSSGSYKTATINPVKYIRLLSWNNAGLTVEFYYIQQ